MKLVDRYKEGKILFERILELRFPKTLFMPDRVLKLGQERNGMAVPPGTLAVLMP